MKEKFILKIEKVELKDQITLKVSKGIKSLKLEKPKSFFDEQSMFSNLMMIWKVF